MSPYLSIINETNKNSLNKPVDSDIIYYSELTEWYTNNAFRSFSLKFVLEDAIFYKIGRQEYKVQKNHLLLSPKQPGVKAYFDSSSIVQSICIDVRPQTIAEAFTSVMSREELNLENYSPEYFTCPEFFENIYYVGNERFASQLVMLARNLKNRTYNNGGVDFLNEEWFLELAESIILQEFAHFKGVNNLGSVKLSTRKETFRRLLMAKEFMDDNFLQSPSIHVIASRANLSDFHFFRSFKQAFSQTPYQYLLDKRLSFAFQKLKQERVQLSEMAIIAGFADEFTFSKAFKRKYGASPNHLFKPAKAQDNLEK